VLKARGFVTPEPHKCPKSSYVRFEADLPNERWQMDVTHVVLATGKEVEILNLIDDHSRLCVASVALRIFKAIDVVTTFHEAAGRRGYPASVLSDNGAIFTAAARHGVCVMGVGTARPRHRLQALTALPPDDLRQGGAASPDSQEVPRRFQAGPQPRCPSAPARRLRGVLQHRPSAPFP
jgi:transposase InsO family protein